MPTSTIRTLFATMPLLLALLASSPALAETFEGKVVKVADGDTITVLRGRAQIRIRLQGIDAPERSQAYGKVAKRFVSDQTHGGNVRVEGKANDKYGRFLGRVFLPDGSCLNEKLVEAGLAWHYVRYSDSRKLAALEKAARAAKRGLWADPHPVAPWDYRHPKRGPLRRVEKSPPVAPGAPVIGNRNSHRFHEAHCRGYSLVSRRNRVPFPSVEAARSAGYKRAATCPPKR